MASTVAYRAAAGALLLGGVVAAGAVPPLGADYARAVALAIPFEVVGTVAFTLALRTGDVSLVQPLFGFLPVTVTVGGALLLDEWPTAAALAGVALVAAGVYGLGLGGSGGRLAPLRALARDPAGRWAAVGVLAWSVTAVVHKLGIAAAGPMPWAATLAVGSALALGVAAPFLPEGLRGRALPEAGAAGRWAGWAVVCGALFAVQQVGLQFALRAAPVGYVTALSATSIVLGVLGGIVLLGERSGVRRRLAGGAMVTVGAVVVALAG